MAMLIILAVLINMAMGIAMEKHRRYHELVANAFRELGFLIHENPDPAIRGYDLVAMRGGRSSVIGVKVAPEGRPDRMIPLLAQAILEVRARARNHPENSDVVAIVAAPRVSRKAAKAVLDYAEQYAPDVAAGIFDLDGRRSFSAHDLQELNAEPAMLSPDAASAPAPDLFSDRNQWMLKVLLAGHLNEPEMLNCPVGDYRNASELAKEANVSVMGAYRLLEQLKHEGFLHESSAFLELVRVRELLHRWQAVHQRPARELPVRWLIPEDADHQVADAMRAYGERACLGLFAAARAHGLDHVSGAPVHVYVPDFKEDGLQRMGVVRARPGEFPDVILRIPRAKESVFRGQIMSARGRAADILQVWLDVASHPSRGKEQADFIYERVLKPRLLS
jgi:hypothetical protein